MQQKTTAPANRGARGCTSTGSTRRVETARRMLNLVFSLSVSPEPLTTDHIISDPEIGYASPERDSRIKAFNRDRDALAAVGVVIREAAAGGNARNEQRSWEIDTAATHAAGGELSPYDAEEAVRAIDQIFLLHADDPARWPLQMARAKLCGAAGIDPGPLAHTTPSRSGALSEIWSSFSRRRPASFSYRDARGDEKPHKVDVYGMFESGNHIYLVGRDHDADSLRTFRTDRILTARKSPDSAKPYLIPAEFDVADFQFLPFDFSQEESTRATFSFGAGVGAYEIALITKGRGAIEARGDGSSVWTVDVHDLDAAATFAIEHAHAGLTALGPAELLSLISTKKEQAVSAHVR